MQGGRGRKEDQHLPFSVGGGKGRDTRIVKKEKSRGWGERKKKRKVSHRHFYVRGGREGLAEKLIARERKEGKKKRRETRTPPT